MTAFWDFGWDDLEKRKTSKGEVFLQLCLYGGGSGYHGSMFVKDNLNVQIILFTMQVIETILFFNSVIQMLFILHFSNVNKLVV